MDFSEPPPSLPLPGPGAMAVVEDDAAAEAVAIAVLEVPQESWAAANAVRRLLFLARKRRPVGDQVLALVAGRA